MNIYRHGDGCPHFPTRERDPETGRIIIPIPYVNIYLCMQCNAVFGVPSEEEPPEQCPCCGGGEFQNRGQLDSRRNDIRSQIREIIG